MANDKMTAQMSKKDGFIAALDQSGGSSPGALRLYGIPDTAYSGDGGAVAAIAAAAVAAAGVGAASTLFGRKLADDQALLPRRPTCSGRRTSVGPHA